MNEWSVTFTMNFKIDYILLKYYNN
uniref:Uncharacterized protein n=1 Tax=Heterorhabditis bacteriophora TaxID=37862 RepID=A0A1I7WZ87_HETBA